MVWMRARGAAVLCGGWGTLPLGGRRLRLLRPTLFLLLALAHLLLWPLLLAQVFAGDALLGRQTLFMRLFTFLLTSLAGVVSYWVSVGSLGRDFASTAEGLRRAVGGGSCSRFTLLLGLFFCLSLLEALAPGLGDLPAPRLSLLATVWVAALAWLDPAAHTTELLFADSSRLLFLGFRALNDSLAGFEAGPRPAHTSRAWGRRGAETGGRRLSARRVEAARRSYTALAEILRLLNKTFELHLLVSLSTLFVRLILCLYLAAYGYGATWHPSHLHTLFRAFVYALRFATQVAVAADTSSQAGRTKGIIASINNRFLDSETKEELVLFLNRISNEKLYFTAYGLFKLNKRFLTSAFAAGATYLVILVQFHPR